MCACEWYWYMLSKCMNALLLQFIVTFLHDKSEEVLSKVHNIASIIKLGYTCLCM